MIEPPVNLGPLVNGKGRNGGATLSADGRTLIFHSSRPGGQGELDLWMSTRASPNEPFGQPVNLGSDVNSSEIESQPTLSGDGLTLIFGRRSTAAEDLWMSTRDTTSDPFGQPVNMGTDVNSNEDEQAPDLSADGLALIFFSTRERSRGLWISRRKSPDDPFGPAMKLEVDSVVPFGPTVSSDRRTLFFTAGLKEGHGSYDLWMSTRTANDGPFGAPVNLGRGINSDKFDSGPCISADGRMLIFESDRPGGHGGFDLWMSRIRRPEDGDGTARTTPPPTVAPFDAAAAKAHQKAWAKHLGLPVERKVPLPGGQEMTFMLIPPGEFMMGSTREEQDRFHDGIGDSPWAEGWLRSEARGIV